MAQTILAVDDEKDIAELLKYYFTKQGYQVITALNGRQALKFAEKKPDLILLDINLPDIDGLSICEKIRNFVSCPIIFLTARDLDEDMIVGFQAGADDYITKPFNVQVLIQRVNAVLRRYQVVQEESARLSVGNLVIDFESYTVMKNGDVLSLTPTEFKLLVKFCQNPGIVLTRKVLLEELWDKEENYVDEHTLTIFVSRLRSKISDETYSYIKTVYGTGYRWIGEEI